MATDESKPSFYPPTTTEQQQQQPSSIIYPPTTSTPEQSIYNELISCGLAPEIATDYSNKLHSHGVSTIVLMHSLTEQDCTMIGITNPIHARIVSQGLSPTDNGNNVMTITNAQIVQQQPNPSSIPIAIPVAEFVQNVYQSTMHHPSYGRFQRNYPVTDDQITAFGGNICNCCSDCSICCYASFCPCCQLVDTITDANELSYCGNCVLICCVPCWFPCGTAIQASNINKQLGASKGTFWRQCCCATWCMYCWICQLARAVKQAKKAQAFPFQQPQAGRRGAPQEMNIVR